MAKISAGTNTGNTVTLNFPKQENRQLKGDEREAETEHRSPVCAMDYAD